MNDSASQRPITNGTERKLSHEEFFKMAILKLRDSTKSRGIHSVFSGFNQAFRTYYDDDPIQATQKLTSEGRIEIRPVKRGFMLYLPGEAPKLREDIGKTALSKILGKPPQIESGLVEAVMGELVPGGVRTFPSDFTEGYGESEKMSELSVPGIALSLESSSKTTVVSKRRNFRYEARNPSEAKYIIYAHRKGEKSILIPKDNRAIFKAVADYEKYSREMRSQCFSSFLSHTSDEDSAEFLTNELAKRLNLA